MPLNNRLLEGWICASLGLGLTWRSLGPASIAHAQSILSASPDVTIPLGQGGIVVNDDAAQDLGGGHFLVSFDTAGSGGCGPGGSGTITGPLPRSTLIPVAFSPTSSPAPPFSSAGLESVR